MTNDDDLESLLRKDRVRFPDGGFGVPEEFWLEHYQFLKDHGYELRPRYRPGWVRSWKDTDKIFYVCEDGVIPQVSMVIFVLLLAEERLHPMQYGQIIDAIHVPTCTMVALKKIDPRIFRDEERNMRHLSSGNLGADPRNHCVPLLEVLRLPEPVHRDILVMPYLRPFTSPPFETVGEVVECIHQLFEGLEYLHENKIAHRDINPNNFMMEGQDICIGGSHPQQPEGKPDMSGPANFSTRTDRPQRYFLIDFGQTVIYTPEDITHILPIVWGGDKSVPEFFTGIPFHDPYATDVYCAGNLIRCEFTEGHPIPEWGRGYRGLDFLKPLVSDMVQDDPFKRPTMKEVVRRYNELIGGLSPWTLRSRIVLRETGFFTNIFHAIKHWICRIKYIIWRISAIPRP
ncbi:hypothetical protein NLJ89_g3446 [Agrocybe chaxingu]|uniref:Protein kinase domain-containing protein n=1 Tax=Agrocybe chaxingu TaxID=84603 RepID=A0A9W8K401_9AGAR|nr:hypothetical protein NLJ89_g3446 [Agrocybe chaxingu]